MPAPTLEMKRINRLLRSLRSTLAVFREEYNLAQARSADIEAQRPKPATKEKGKQKEDDEEYGARKRAAPSRKTHQLDSSPSRQPKGTTSRREKTVRSKQGTATHKSVTASTELPKSFVFPPRGWLTSNARHSYGMEATPFDRFGSVINAYSNALQAVYPTRYDLGQDGQFPRTVPTLVELAAQSLGWELEDLIMSHEDDDDDSDEESSSGRTRNGSDRWSRAGSGSPDDEDENILIEEWYSACPDYARNWVFAQHATAIVLGSLAATDINYFALNHVFLVAVSLGAAAEAARFFEPLCSLGFKQSTLLGHSINVARAVFPLRLVDPYFSTLSTALLSSPFSSRLFESKYISFDTLYPTSRLDVTLWARLLVMQLEVAYAMLESIVDLRSEDDDEDEKQEVDDLLEEVASRMEAQLDVIFDHLGRSAFASSDEQSLLDEVLNVLFHLVTDFRHVTEESLAPFIIFFVLLNQTTKENHLSSIARLSDLVVNSTLSHDILFAHFEAAVNLHSIKTFTAFMKILHEAGYLQLEVIILTHLIYDEHNPFINYDEEFLVQETNMEMARYTGLFRDQLAEAKKMIEEEEKSAIRTANVPSVASTAPSSSAPSPAPSIRTTDHRNDLLTSEADAIDCLGKGTKRKLSGKVFAPVKRRKGSKIQLARDSSEESEDELNML